MATVRVREDGPWGVTHPDGYDVVLKPGDAYDAKDPLVRTFPWAFGSDNVEQATASPGERRNVRR